MYVSDLEREVIEHVTKMVRKSLSNILVANGNTVFECEELIPPFAVAVISAPIVCKILDDMRNDIYEAEKKRG